MAESIKVWVKTSTLDTAVYGKAKSTAKRSIPDAHAASFGAGADEGESKVVNWGWAKATLVEGGHAGGDGNLDGSDDATPLKIFVRDEESEHDRATIELPGSVVKEGGLVMANTYGVDGTGGGGAEYDSDDEEDGGGPDAYPDDLITLTHLHEPAVVHCLRRRYAYDKIYTATGPILLALNPFKTCRDLYSDAVMKKYWQRGEASMLVSSSAASSSPVDGEEKKSDDDGGAGLSDDEPLPPHVYGIADNSFRTMMLRLDESSGSGRRPRAPREGSKGCDQSILVSGESGAGKTVTTKFIMKYLATLSQRSADAKTRGSSSGNGDKKQALTRGSSSTNVNIEQQVLQSNPILESFGNARTIRNDNSSRFGKFIEIQFTNTGSLVGASIETYLLEKVRLLTQAEGERNYHIFYELLQGMEEDDLDKYFLGDYTAEDFRMTSNSGTYDRRDGVDDCETYQELLEAMDTMGFTPEEQADILTITCATLHFSNLTVNSLSADESEIDRDNAHLDAVLSLMGVTADALNRALCYFSIQAGKEKHTRSLPKQKAEKGIEGLIKATYGALFTHIVQRINASIHSRKDLASKRGSSGRSSGKAATIGVLDIFGFESFKTNSFEQLCINYCNEALQQQFNLFVLKNEQEEYEREGIQWKFISFPENQDVLDLIDKKGSGILNILDDQCRAPGTTDKTFANDIYQKCTGHSRFEANFRQVGARRFGIFHYAGPVEYDTEGFVEKNRDELPKEATELLLSSTNEFVKKLAHIVSGPAASAADAKSPSGRGRRSASAGTRVTVGGQFSRQLHELRQKIDLTSPHYVRCLKPNDMLFPDRFDPVIIADQLRCAGVVEAVRVSRVGYPQRYSHSQFVSRYRILGLAALKKALRGSRRVKPVEVLVNAIAEKVWEVESKAGNVAKGGESGVDLVSVGLQLGKTKVFLRRRAFDILERLRRDQMTEAAVRMQAQARAYIGKREYQGRRSSALRLQCCARRMIAQRRVQEVRCHHNATVIQTASRRMVALRSFVATRSIALWTQRIRRGVIARALYDSLNRVRKALVVQKYWRRHVMSKHYQAMRRCSLIIQSAFRCHQAHVALKNLRSKARDLQATASERDNLRKQTQKLELELEEAKLLAKREAERAAKMAVDLDSASSNEAAQLDEMREEVVRLRADLENAQLRIKKESDRAGASDDNASILSKKLDHLLEEKNVVDGQLRDAISALEEKGNELSSLKDESIQLKVELQEAKESISLLQSKAEDAAEAKRLRSEVEALKTELAGTEHVPSSSVETDADRNLKQEVERLEKALEKERDARVSDKSLHSDDMDKIKRENEQLRRQIEAAETRNGADRVARRAIDTGDDADHHSRELDNEILELKNMEIEDLRKQIARSESRVSQEHERAEAALVAKAEAEAKAARLAAEAESTNEVGHGGDDSGAAAEEILTLQDEIERLNKELASARVANGDDVPDSSSNLIRRYDELRRLAEAGIEKDKEIEDLKQEIVDLKEDLGHLQDELDACQPGELAETEPDDSSSEKRPSEVINRGPLSLFRRRTDGEDGDIALVKKECDSLRDVNEMLRKEVEQARRESQEAKRKLREEAERSAMELEAFAETLKGVDELRKAAESMSREIHRIKRQGYKPSEESGGMNNYGPVTDAMEASEAMENANKIIASGQKQQEGVQLWSKVRAGVFGQQGDFRRSGRMERRPSGGSNIDSQNPDKRRKERRRRKKRGDDASVISAFF